MSERFRILPGLAATGPMPEQFSATGQGKHSEGWVVEFTPTSGETWVGNFQPGFTSCCGAYGHPDGSSMVVVAGGTGYIVNIETRQLLHTFGGGIETVIPDLERRQLVFGDGLFFEALSAAGIRWRTRRISWDGMRRISSAGSMIAGEAEDLDGTWRAFRVDLETGTASGGSYNGPDAPSP
jgi:hypothetical protein